MLFVQRVATLITLLLCAAGSQGKDQAPWEVEIDEDGIKIECRIRQKSTRQSEVETLSASLTAKQAEISQLNATGASREELLQAEKDAEELEQAIAINTKEKTGYKYCKATAQAPFPMSELIAINLDAEGLQDWMDTVKMSFQAKKFSDKNYINCMQYDIPVFPDREACAETNIHTDLDSGEFKLIFSLVDNLVNTIGHDPMKIIKGYWKFNPTDHPNKTLLEYGTYVEPGGVIIPFLYNPRAAQIPFRTIKQMFELLQTGKYADTQIPFQFSKEPRL
ncbi:MAG: hypothetical protein C9356_19385 [Oleiphilus sp.]|nr:MAG: hypothetical protein C9356_19385 [Oleiphilus sp.]